MNKQLLIIIGLPGSGKTTLVNTLNDYIIFDDFISKFYNGQAISQIKKNKKVCLNDPRLCIPKIFNYYMEILLKFIGKENIKLLLFENDPIKCLYNINKRDDNRKGIEDAINNYSQLYDIDIYKDYDYEILIIKTD